MSPTTVVRRLAAAVAASAAVVLATLALASPAYAADSVEVNFSGVSGSTTAGARTFDSVSATFVNRTNNSIAGIQPVFTVQLAGMPSDGVRILRTLGAELGVQSAGDGTVRITDPSSFELLRNGRRTVTYQLQFTASAPSGKAAITLEAYASGNRLGGDNASTTVKGTAAPHTSSATTPANTATGVIPTFAAGPSYSLAAPPVDTDTQTLATDVPVSLYVMGALLIGIGGVILFLLFRRQKPIAAVAAYPTTEYDPIRPPSLGYPTSRGGSLHPTAVLPTVRDPEPPSPRPGPGGPR